MALIQPSSKDVNQQLEVGSIKDDVSKGKGISGTNVVAVKVVVWRKENDGEQPSYLKVL